jgi:type IV pilus assembly protein PilB
MIGEIRDGETASIAVQASITGHLVVSTLHTNDTASSVTRLLDMGVESYLIADSTVGIIAQRLVRRLCPHCRKGRPLYDHEANYLKIPAADRARQMIFEPAGCRRCNNVGYYGRIGVYEIMEITPHMRTMIARRTPATELRQAAIDEGMETLGASVRRLVLEGTTSIMEMQRISVVARNNVDDISEEL